MDIFIVFDFIQTIFFKARDFLDANLEKFFIFIFSGNNANEVNYARFAQRISFLKKLTLVLFFLICLYVLFIPFVSRIVRWIISFLSWIVVIMLVFTFMTNVVRGNDVPRFIVEENENEQNFNRERFNGGLRPNARQSFERAGRGRRLGGSDWDGAASF